MTIKPNIEIRKVVKDDLVHIFKIEEKTFKPMNYPLFVLRQFFDILSDLFFVAVDESNQIKGYCFGGIDHEKRIGWILALAVTKQNQRKKIGHQITVELIKAFKHKNVHTIQLTTTPDNFAAIKLYEKLGFKTIEQVVDYYLDGSPRIIMKLEIA